MTNLKPFGSVTQCPKCQHVPDGGFLAKYMAHELGWRNHGNSTFKEQYVAVGPHLIRACQRCGYSWKEGCAKPVEEVE